MSDWGSYELIHLVPFGKDVYFRLIARLNDAAYPQQLATLGVGIVALLSAWQRHTLPATLYLAPLWATSALIFFFGGYRELHWAGHLMGYLFLAQAPLLVWLGWHHSRHGTHAEPRQSRDAGGVCLMILGLALWPLCSAWLGGGPTRADVVGIHADATAMFGAGVAITVFRGRTRALLLLTPLLWLTVTALTHSALQSALQWPLLAVLLLAATLPLVHTIGNIRRQK